MYFAWLAAIYKVTCAIESTQKSTRIHTVPMSPKIIN